MVQPVSNEQVAVQRRTTLASIAAASLLVILKLGVGLIAGSLALISAGIESSGDVLAAILTFFAVRLGRQPADPEHPYGHGRAENLGALGEAGILLAGGLVVAVEAARHLISPSGTPDTHWYVFVVIAIALAVDLARTVISLRTARRYGSPALRANGFHFAGDMAGSVAVLIGLLLVRAGFAGGDASAALVIAAIILAAAARLIAENANVLMDRTPAEAREAAERALARLEPDIELVRLRLRESAGRYFADVIVAVAPGRRWSRATRPRTASRQRSRPRCPAAMSSSTSSLAAAAWTSATECSQSRWPSRRSRKHTTSRSTSTTGQPASPCI